MHHGRADQSFTVLVRSELSGGPSSGIPQNTKAFMRPFIVVTPLVVNANMW